MAVIRMTYDILRGAVFAVLLYYAIDRLIFGDVGGIVFRYAGY
jgi:hypothetical protein